MVKGLKDDFRVIKLSFLAVIVSLSGWLAFEGVTKMFQLEKLNPLTQIILGLFIAWITFYIGINKIK